MPAVTDQSADHPVLVVGAGIAGLSCAQVLHRGGVDVEVLDRGRHVGGRMASRFEHGRAVDTGASYLTAEDPVVGALVKGWLDRGLARPWTDTFAVAGPTGITGSTTGPMRYGTAGGLAPLMGDLATGLTVHHQREVEEVDGGPTVDGRAARAVVLAMPGPQACDLLSDEFEVERDLVCGTDWLPTLALAAAWDHRRWPDVDGVFVNDSPVLTWIADDGRRRGDGAPVLVAHTTPDFARAHLDDPESGTTEVLAALGDVLGFRAPPTWTLMRRWSLSRPGQARSEPYHLGSGGVSLCGDGWHAPSKVGSAYLSGRALGQELLRRLTGPGGPGRASVGGPLDGAPSDAVDGPPSGPVDGSTGERTQVAGSRGSASLPG